MNKLISTLLLSAGILTIAETVRGTCTLSKEVAGTIQIQV